MANIVSTVENNISIPQMKCALGHIAHLACSIQGVCDAIIENGDER